jgi:Serine protease inhibitor
MGIFTINSCNRKVADSAKERANDVTKNVELKQNIVKQSNDFAFNFFKQINDLESKKEKDIFVSPLSASLAFSMASAGAEGKTQQEMLSALDFNGDTQQQVNDFSYYVIKKLLSGDKTTKILVANSIWTLQGFPVYKQFTDILTKYYFAENRVLDLNEAKAVKEVNKWCSDNTQGLIKEMVSNISGIKVMLINALYFKGVWKDQFNKSNTHPDKFFNIDGSQTEVDFMYRSFKGRIWHDDTVSLINLPYGNGKFEMSVILPNKESDIDEFISTLSAENIDKWVKCNSNYKIRLLLPKFNSEYETSDNLIKAMQNLGMNLAFTSQADFSKMSKFPLMIDRANQKAVIKVNEEGTEAAAVTTIGMRLTSIAPQEPTFDFTVNRPFVYLIREVDSGAVLFIGKKSKF